MGNDNKMEYVMITDEERREIAARLREIEGETVLPTTGEFIALLAEAVDFYFYIKPGRYCDEHLLGRIADLIDRPTCRLNRTVTESMSEGSHIRCLKCSECGRSCDERHGEYEYCPHCGARVANDGC